MKKAAILQLYAKAETARIPDDRKLLLISINKTVEDETLSLYDKVRYSWNLATEEAKGRLVLAVAFGLIVGVFEADEWLDATQMNFGEIPEHHGNWNNQNRRYGFRGREASKQIGARYRYKRVPEELRNHGAPIRYVN